MVDVLPVLGTVYFSGEGALLEISLVLAILYLAGPGGAKVVACARNHILRGRLAMVEILPLL